MKVNLGCGQAYMPGWVNVDAYPEVKADIYADAVDFVRDHGHECEQIYMGHFLEHLMPADARSLLRLMVDRMPGGATVSAVTPDMREIFRAYDRGEIANEDLNASFVYSYVQPSRHVWCYDTESLRQLFERVGFADVAAIDPLTWEPVFHKEGPESLWQCGVRATVPNTKPATNTDDADDRFAVPRTEVVRNELPATANELLLTRLERLEDQLDRERERARQAAEAAGAAQRANADLDAARREIDLLHRSRALRLGQAVRRIADKALPPGSISRRRLSLAVTAAREINGTITRTRAAERNVAAPNDEASPYERWCSLHDVNDGELDQQRASAASMERPARFLAVVIARDEVEAMRRTVGSLQAQSWPHWEAAVLIDPDRTNDAFVEGERRVRPQPTSRESIIEQANMVVSRSDEVDFVLFLEAGDQLAPDCLYHAAATASQDPLLDLLYWDDDIVDESGRRHSPVFRPSWSPEMLLGRDYIGRSFALRIRRFLYEAGLRTAHPDALFWDLLLRSDLSVERTKRVPRVLSHLHARTSAPAAAGVPVVQEHLERQGWAATAEQDGELVRVRWTPEEWPTVSIIIPTRHNRPMIDRCLASLQRTDYPQFDVLIVDNGPHTPQNEEYYRRAFPDLPLRIEWWDEPFNYSAVNNHGARLCDGQVLVFLNDDTEAPDPAWLKELVGWATVPGVGCAGLQLLGLDGVIQFAGTIVGLLGFAEHVFHGLDPDTDTMFGPVRSYRDVLAVTGACLAVRRDAFEDVGGFDQRFILCGSDVALGLDLVLKGLRNVCSPFSGLNHLESATRGTNVPRQDFFISYWRYQSWLMGGDPYFSPNLSINDRVPQLAMPEDKPLTTILSETLGRSFAVFRQRADAGEASGYADACRATRSDVRAVRALHAANAEPFEPESVNWFIPDIDSPFYGGINTALRIADHLQRNNGVESRFIVWGPGPEDYTRTAIAAAFPSLADSPIVFHDGSLAASLRGLPAADVSISTLWVTAYQLLHFPDTRRKFYLVQDFEPVFNPAGTLYALAEETYRLGLYGLCNTDVMRQIYEDEYGGHGQSFIPAIDPTVFHAEGRRIRLPGDPVTVFVYARAGHWRNCWEMASLALKDLKERLGDGVRIVAAGSWANEDAGAIDMVVKHVGLLDYRATGDLYRQCDVGLALTVSKHPSYLPIELMACGVPVVAFDSPHFSWLLRDGQNSLLAERTVDGVADALERLVVDEGLRDRLARQGLADIAANHSSWDKALAGIYPFLADPEGRSTRR